MSISSQLEKHFNEIIPAFISFLEGVSNNPNSSKVTIAETYQNLDNKLIELKLNWKTPVSPHGKFAEFITFKGKLAMINQILQISELERFLKDLDYFQHHFLEFREPWKVTSWKYFYSETNSSLTLYDNRKAIIESHPNLETRNLSEFLESRVNEHFADKLIEEMNFRRLSLLEKAKSLLILVEFQAILEKMRELTGETFTEGLRYYWDQFVKKESPTQVDISILAFLLRLSVEFSLRNRFPKIIPSNERLSLGKIFERLQVNGFFTGREQDIQSHLDPLNEIAHGKQKKIDINGLNEIRKWFRVLLKEEDVSFPLAG